MAEFNKKVIQTKSSVLKITDELKSIAGSDQIDHAYLDLLYSKLENIKQGILREIRILEAKERGIYGS